MSSESFTFSFSNCTRLKVGSGSVMMSPMLKWVETARLYTVRPIPDPLLSSREQALKEEGGGKEVKRGGGDVL